MVRSILFLTEEYNHPALSACGGIGVSTQMLSKKFSALGIAVYVLYVQEKKTFLIKDGDVTIIGEKCNLPFYKKILAKMVDVKNNMLHKQKGMKYSETLKGKLLARIVCRMVKKYDIDIVEVYDYKGLYRGLSRLQKSMVVRCRGSYAMIHATDESFNSLRENEKKAFAIAQNVVAVSDATADFTKKYFKLKNISVIHNGIDTDMFSGNQSSFIPFSVFYVGTMNEAKGIPELLSFFSELLLHVPKATLHLIGRGREYIERQIKMLDSSSIRENIFYYDNVDRKELPGLLTKAHVFVSLSRSESFGLTTIEAMAMGKPVIIKNISVAKEIIDDGVDGFIADDTKACTNIIIELFGNNVLASRIGLNARRKVVEKFSIQKTVMESIAYYNNILS